MCNILNSISFVNLYTELATVIRLAVVVVFFFLIWHPDVYNCHHNNNSKTACVIGTARSLRYVLNTCMSLRGSKF